MVKSRYESEYIEYVNPIWVILVLNGFYLLWAGIYDPEQIPKYFGPLGDLTTFLGKDYNLLMKIILVAAVFMHVAESIYAISICRELHLDSSSTIKWSIQTFIMGMFSLRLLIRHYKIQKEKNTK